MAKTNKKQKRSARKRAEQQKNNLNDATNNNQETNDDIENLDIYTYEHQLNNITTFFPKVNVTKYSDILPNHQGSDFITEIALPNCYTLVKKCIGMRNKITFISFIVKEKDCDDKLNQKPGLHIFSA